MENNSGNTLKIIAIIFGVLGVIGSIVLGVMVGNNTYIDGLGFGVFVGTALSSFLSALVLYGFGELIDNSSQINTRMAKTERQLEEIKSRLNAAPAAARVPQAAKATPVTAPKAAAKPAAAPAAKAAVPAEKKAPEDVPAGFENLNTTRDVYEYFCELYEGKQSEDSVEMEKILINLCQREESGERNMYEDAVSRLRAFYRNGCRVYEVDRSGATFTCPNCGKEARSNRKVCVECGALFRD